MFSICTVLYGDYPQLAQRLLDSWKLRAHVQDFRIGLNAVGDKTRKLVETWAKSQVRREPVYVYEAVNADNLGKYPLMRAMFYDRPLASRVMWFDDDSFLDQSVGVPWWDTVLVSSLQVTQLGAVHQIRQRHMQHAVIRQQPWYTGKPVDDRHLFRFVTGGWWVADSAFIQKWDYPFPALYHNGGDSILGELIRQQSGILVHFTPHIRCHCESCAAKPVLEDMPVAHINVGGRKGRRGIGVTQENYVWADGCTQPSLEHQNFDLKVQRYEV
jgi:hypothetical protein